MDGMASTPTKLAQSLNAKLAGGPNAGAYNGPWGFMTLGGAGGQTVFGALTTGTHGGDFRQRPISDAVVALHLVTDGGDHFWIEPLSSQIRFPIADDAKLHAVYGRLNPKVTFKIIRDNDVFHSVVVGVGRFGVVVSMVLRVVPQYCLLEHRRLDNWTNIKSLLKGPARHHAFDFAFFAGPHANRAEFDRRFNTAATAPNRFLQIAINLSPHHHDEHRCGVTQRWFHPNTKPEAIDPNTGDLRGRRERGTLATAGKSPGYEPPDSPKNSGSSSGTFISRACGNGNFIAGILREVAKEFEQIIVDNAVTAGGIVAGALAVGAGAVVLAVASVCAVLATVVVALRTLADAIDATMGDTSLAQIVNTGIKAVEAVPGLTGGLKIMLLRILFKMIFESQQSDRDYVAISYAVMDGHDYLDRSCFGNVESIEIFFDASRPDVYCSFVDAVLAFEAAQEERAEKFAVGYVSLRYIRGSQALIAPSQFLESVAIEISGLRDAEGSVPFIMNAVRLARNPMFAGCFHWGQFNPLARPEVEKLYDGAPEKRLSRWRDALYLLTKNGTMDGFSSTFTRHAGLEPT
ncbi:hypothetical protein BN873_1070016 [Candidatus Competibacter denitrificans Run_A_D11]|uniref:Uncharacterized protein n=1 Tax=Candidatus Competibacter denitrificans Run_A_D11 TaxID=1400863 RepID=W6M3S8_9GAMM|nr:hypothetical protein [Candidatus Competibacter denitrificans]CDI01134.1 hypothetical protein BN873_1070016 [Candidatus Competibacter denitrificans Run_A_D11]